MFVENVAYQVHALGPKNCNFLPLHVLLDFFASGTFCLFVCLPLFFLGMEVRHEP